MTHAWKLAAVVALALGAAGCNDFLSGNGVSTDPNNIDRLTRPGPLYIGIQAAQGVQFQGQLARNAAMYVQQIAGNSRQQIGFDRYAIDPVTIDPNWTSVYGSNRTLNGGGGLLDIRKMEQLARGLGDSLYIGIGKVYEALVMGMAADVWGDIPYREAADSTNPTPAFDPQLQVYADLQAQLDSAITIYLPAAGPSNLGPPQDNAELIYGGRDAAEVQVGKMDHDPHGTTTRSARGRRRYSSGSVIASTSPSSDTSRRLCRLSMRSSRTAAASKSLPR